MRVRIDRGLLLPCGSACWGPMAFDMEPSPGFLECGCCEGFLPGLVPRVPLQYNLTYRLNNLCPRYGLCSPEGFDQIL